MPALRTRGQEAASRAVAGLVAGGLPHALLLSGPPSVGKTTLAIDLAATLACTAPDPADRPCGTCRGCRLVAAGSHPDVHRLAPDGAAGLIGVDAVRGLASALALLPVEGGPRVAIVEDAHRLSEDAQHALLKTLEEPPSGVTIVLCVDDEERLLPTVRSRCARVRLGPVAGRSIEALLDELDLADAPTASRLARLAGGRAGLALGYARTPEAAAARAEATRTLVDLADAGPAARLRTIRDLLALADGAASALAASMSAGANGGAERPATTRMADDRPAEAADSVATPRASAKDRRRAAAWLVEAWRGLTRDLAVVAVGDRPSVADPSLLDELERLAGRIDVGQAVAFLARLDRARSALDSSASPELVMDVLALAWPRPTAPVAR
jgi:DNA polymerase-3 subunit delta'